MFRLINILSYLVLIINPKIFYRQKYERLKPDVGRVFRVYFLTDPGHEVRARLVFSTHERVISQLEAIDTKGHKSTSRSLKLAAGTKSLDELCINTIRLLSADMIQQANSGHPGLPLGAATMAYVLWSKFLRFNPRNPKWPNRDRFVLSAGHGSALLYSLLHLSGFDLTIEDIQNFRQWKSKTPGHPEYGVTPGVESTTGPLGQGFAMGVGMAMAERFLAAHFNKPGYPVQDHFTYAIVSDGDLMEGVASEAASLAGHLKLGKMIYLYDDNHISIEGDTSITFTEDVEARFKAYGWHVLKVFDGNDVMAIEKAIRSAQLENDRPSLIMVKTEIGFGSPKQGSASAHGEPLGQEALDKTKQNFCWPGGPCFHVPDEVLEKFRRFVDVGQKLENEWNFMLRDYGSKFPEQSNQFLNQTNLKLPDGWELDIPVFGPSEKGEATRVSSGKVLNAIAKRVPNIVGGSADLAPSTKTLISGDNAQTADDAMGRNIHFGVREFAMGAVVNGMALHGGIIPYGATFLIFSDYMRPAIRLAALMNVHSIFVFTHDSIAVGEDGPTHQPVEQLASLRAIPNLTVLRPADANETAEAWKVAMSRKGPVALILTRQNVPTLDRASYGDPDGFTSGAYIVSDVTDPELLIIATGSEVSLALKAQEKLANDNGVRARVISMPSWELFMEQPKEYQEQLLPPYIKARVSIEAASSMGWSKWVGSDGISISIDQFGVSAPGSEALDKFGFNLSNVCNKCLALLGKS